MILGHGLPGDAGSLILGHGLALDVDLVANLVPLVDAAVVSGIIRIAEQSRHAVDIHESAKIGEASDNALKCLALCEIAQHLRLDQQLRSLSGANQNAGLVVRTDNHEGDAHADEPRRVRAIRFGVHLLQGNHAGNRLGTLHRQGDGDGDVLGLSVLGRNNAHNHGIENPLVGNRLRNLAVCAQSNVLNFRQGKLSFHCLIS